MSEEIDPRRLYSVREAAALLPSPRNAAGSHPQTVRRWIAQGWLRAEVRASGRRRFWFVWGAELLRFINATPPPVPELVSPAVRAREDAAVWAELGELGMRVPERRPGKE